MPGNGYSTQLDQDAQLVCCSMLTRRHCYLERGESNLRCVREGTDRLEALLGIVLCIGTPVSLPEQDMEHRTRVQYAVDEGGDELGR